MMSKVAQRATILTREEYRFLRSQTVTLETGRGKYSKYLPFAFTEHGVAMLSGVLNSPKAIETNIAIIRAFIALRQYALHYTELEQHIAELEAHFGQELTDVHEVLRWLGEENQPGPTTLRLCGRTIRRIRIGKTARESGLKKNRNLKTSSAVYFLFQGEPS